MQSWRPLSELHWYFPCSRENRLLLCCRAGARRGCQSGGHAAFGGGTRQSQHGRGGNIAARSGGPPGALPPPLHCAGGVHRGVSAPSFCAPPTSGVADPLTSVGWPAYSTSGIVSRNPSDPGCALGPLVDEGRKCKAELDFDFDFGSAARAIDVIARVILRDQCWR